MARILFNGNVVWDKPYLPNEKRAANLLQTYANIVCPEAAEALSIGIDVKTGENWFRVKLSSDRPSDNLSREK